MLLSLGVHRRVKATHCVNEALDVVAGSTCLGHAIQDAHVVVMPWPETCLHCGEGEDIKKPESHFSNMCETEARLMGLLGSFGSFSTVFPPRFFAKTCATALARQVRACSKISKPYRAIHPCTSRGFFGVFDGHGGQQCSSFVARRLTEASACLN